MKDLCTESPTSKMHRKCDKVPNFFSYSNRSTDIHLSHIHHHPIQGLDFEEVGWIDCTTYRQFTHRDFIHVSKYILCCESMSCRS